MNGRKEAQKEQRGGEFEYAVSFLSPLSLFAATCLWAAGAGRDNSLTIFAPRPDTSGGASP
jgi:hypothetical protein